MQKQLVAFVLLFSAMLGASALVPSGDDWSVRPDGIGPVKIGMTLAELNQALNEKFRAPESKDDQACFYVKPEKYSQFAFMIEDGRVTRVDVGSRGVKTSEGVQIGDSEQEARRVYGSRLKVEPHQYDPAGHYLTWRSNDGRYGIRFESDGKKIDNFYAGRFSAIQYVEGCL